MVFGLVGAVTVDLGALFSRMEGVVFYKKKE